MKSLSDRADRVRLKYPVAIPNVHGDGVATTVEVEVEALRDPDSGETFLDAAAREKIEAVKARHLGLLTTEQIKELRAHLDLTQKEISELLQIGEKTWTRWETGRERPSRSLNVLLNAIYDGRVDLTYLRGLLRPELRTRPVEPQTEPGQPSTFTTYNAPLCENETVPA